MNTDSKPEIAVHTIEQQNAGNQPHYSQLTQPDDEIELEFDRDSLRKAWRNDPEMITEFFLLMSRQPLRATLLYLLIVIRDQAVALGRHLDLAEILDRCHEGRTPQVRRWVKHLLKEAAESALIGREEPKGEYRILEAGHQFIQQATTTRMALWRLNPRMPAAQIHAIVVEEECDHPLHYNTNMQKHVIQPVDGIPSPRKTGKQGVRRDKPQANTAKAYGDPFHSLAAATGAWGRA